MPNQEADEAFKAYLKETYPHDTSFLDDANPYQNSPAVRLLRYMVGDDQITGSAYAWGKTARIICEPAYQAAVSNTEGPVVALDLCSSYPIWPQILKDQRKMDCFDSAGMYAGLVVRALQTKTGTLLPGLSIPTVGDLDDIAKRRIRDTVSPRRSQARLLMQTAVGELLADPPKDNKVQQAVERLMSKFDSSVLVFGKAFELEELVGRGRWETLVPKMGVRTFNQEIALLAGNDQIAAQLAKDIATFLVNASLYSLRQHTVVSLDIESPNVITENAQKSFPGYIKGTKFFRSAGTFENHAIGNIFALPFATESATFISCVEGYPFYFKNLSMEEHESFADSIASTLKPGGQAVFFPWHLNRYRRGGRQLLNEVERRWQTQGLKIKKKIYYKGDLEHQMGDRETMLTMHSPVFWDRTRSNLTALVLEKPK